MQFQDRSSTSPVKGVPGKDNQGNKVKTTIGEVIQGTFQEQKGRKVQLKDLVSGFQLRSKKLESVTPNLTTRGKKGIIYKIRLGLEASRELRLQDKTLKTDFSPETFQGRGNEV